MTDRAEVIAKAEMVKRRYGATTKGTAEAVKPKTKVSFKGTNPLKEKFAVQIKRTW